MPTRKSKSPGFTLIEVLVAMVVLAVLSVSSVLAFSTQVKRARDAKRKADLERIKTAIYDYYFDQDCFPETLPTCGADLKVGETVYLKNFPCDPQAKPYIYQTDRTHCRSFKILTSLENTSDTNIDRIGCRTGCGPSCQYNYGLASSNILVYDGCVKYFACNPGGQCQQYDNPEESVCPVTFKNNPTCDNLCGDGNRENRCKNASGKQEPGANEPHTKEPTSTPTPTLPLTPTPTKGKK